MREETEGCEFCGSLEHEATATLIKCLGCGRVWGRVNGAWVLDPSSMPQPAHEDDAMLTCIDTPVRPPPSIGRLLLLASAIRSAAIECQDAAAAGNANGAMQRASAIQKLADTVTRVLNGESEE